MKIFSRDPYYMILHIGSISIRILQLKNSVLDFGSTYILKNFCCLYAMLFLYIHILSCLVWLPTLSIYNTINDIICTLNIR